MLRYVKVFFQSPSIEMVLKILHNRSDDRLWDIRAEARDLKSVIVSAGELSKLYAASRSGVRLISLARMGKLIPAGLDESDASPYIRVRWHPLYTEGLYFTRYSHPDVRWHLGTKTTAQKTGMQHLQLDERLNPVVGAMEAYEAGRARRNLYSYPPLVIYQVLPRGCSG